mgnify:CR=1 FL=1
MISSYTSQSCYHSQEAISIIDFTFTDLDSSNNDKVFIRNDDSLMHAEAPPYTSPDECR